MGIKLRRLNLEHEFLVDMITNNGFLIEKDSRYMSTNVDQMINSSKFMECTMQSLSVYLVTTCCVSS